MRGVYYSACSLCYKTIAQFHQKCLLMRDCLLFRRLLLPESTVPTSYMQLCQRCSYRGEVRGARAPLEFGRSVNPIQTRGADYAPHYCQPPTPLISKSFLFSFLSSPWKLDFRINDLPLIFVIMPKFWLVELVLGNCGLGLMGWCDNTI